MTDRAKITRGEIFNLSIPELSPTLKMKVHATTDRYVSKSIMESGIWETDETQFLLKVLKPGHVFVDVGANIGYFSLIGSRLVGEDGQVLAFEPESDNYELLEANCQLNNCSNLSCFNMALGAEDAEGKIYLNETNKGDHAISPAEDGRASQDIRIVNGSDFIGEQHARVDCIKIDTQGYECKVLEGLLPLLKDSMPGLIMIIEFSPIHLRNAGTSGHALLDQLGRLKDPHLYVLDQPSGGLLPITDEALRKLGTLTENNPSGEGYANLVVSGRALESHADLHTIKDWGVFEDPLSYLLLANRMLSWDGEFCDADNLDRYFYLPQGWAFPEDWGRWSIGTQSRLKFLPGDALRNITCPFLHIRGRYFGGCEPTGLIINGEYLGDFELTDCSVRLPDGALEQRDVCLEFLHSNPMRPADCGDSTDQREIKFGLEVIAIRAGIG